MPTVTEFEKKKTDLLANFTRFEFFNHVFEKAIIKRKAQVLNCLKLRIGIKNSQQKYSELFEVLNRIVSSKLQKTSKSRSFFMFLKQKTKNQNFFLKKISIILKNKNLSFFELFLHRLKLNRIIISKKQDNFLSLNNTIKHHHKTCLLFAISTLKSNENKTIKNENTITLKKYQFYEKKVSEIQSNFEVLQKEFQKAIKSNQSLSKNYEELKTELEKQNANILKIENEKENQKAEISKLKLNILENSKCILKSETNIKQSLTFQDTLKSTIITQQSAFEKISLKLQKKNTKIEKLNSEITKKSEQVNIQSDNFEKSHKSGLALQKNILILTENSREQEKVIHKKDSEIGQLTIQLKTQSEETTRVKNEKSKSEESRINSLQTKLDLLFRENEAIKLEASQQQTLFSENHKSTTLNRNALANENKELKSSISKLNKEKIDFFRDLSVLNDRYQALLAQQDDKNKVIRDYENKLEEYEEQLQKCKVIIEQLTQQGKASFEHNQFGFETQEVSFVSSKSNREKFSVKGSRGEKELEDSHDDIMKRVSKIHEKYAKVKTDKKT